MLSVLCWLSHAGGTVHQTFKTRWPWLPSGFGTCVEQPAVICQECTVADDVPSRAEDCTVPVVVWQWLGDRYLTAQYNCCLPATTDCWRFCHFVCFSFLFNFVQCPCNVFDVISVTLISTLLLTYLLTEEGKKAAKFNSFLADHLLHVENSHIKIDFAAEWLLKRGTGSIKWRHPWHHRVRINHTNSNHTVRYDRNWGTICVHKVCICKTIISYF